jgi:hypothetical protein
LREGDETPNGIVQIGTTVKIVIGAARQQDAAGRSLRCGANARNRIVEIVNRMRGVGRRVLDAKTGQTRLDAGANRRGAFLRIRTESIFEIAVNREAAGAPQEFGMRYGLVTRYGVNSVLTAERKGKAERRAAQRFESRARE